jgi:hypothetical protein
MRHRSNSFLLLAVLSLAGCQLVPAPWGTKQNDKLPVRSAPPVAGETVLYARDGSVVTPAAGAGTAAIPRRDVQGGDGSRAKILELYQRVVEERDRLQLSLAERDSELISLHKQLDATTARAGEFEARMKTAEHTTSELTDQNLDLAGRLTMAQIRRLEAEKKWLELSIAVPGKTVAASMSAPTTGARAKTEPAALPTVKPSEKPPVKSDVQAPVHHE